MQALANEHVVSAAEMVMMKTEYELAKEGLRQAERKLESRRLQVELAKVEYQQAIEANRQSPSKANGLEAQRKKLLVEIAEAKVREIAD
jgi:hypothetical protein